MYHNRRDLLLEQNMPHKSSATSFYSVKDNTSTIYLREPLPELQARTASKNFNITSGNTRLSPISSTFYNFEDTIVHWYRDLLLEDVNSTDSTRDENHLFAAHGLTPLEDTA